MEHSLAVNLPPLRRKILRSFLVVVLLYGIMGSFIMAAVYFASGITPTLIHVNYDSIAAAHQMQEAMHGLLHPEDLPDRKASDWVAQFEKAMAFEISNVTEPGEEEIAKAIQTEWARAKPRIAGSSRGEMLPTWRKIHDLTQRLVDVNERGMFTLAESSTRLRSRVLLGAILLFIVTLLYALYLSDALAERVSRPLKDIAEALRNKPVPGQKLKLPTPTSLELRILTFEMTQLWKRLSELRELNIEEIANQRSKLEIVLESVEDAILVLDGYGTVLQCNPGLSRLLGLPEAAVEGHHWRDLSTSDPNYLSLRETLVPNLAKDTTLELDVGGTARIYSARCRNILNEAKESIGTLYLLHDITEVRQRERLKAEFIGVLSHELKTPLQSLGTAAELMMKRKDSLDPDGRMLVETIYEDVERIRGVAHDIVQVSFVDPHVLRLRVGKHALSELLQEWLKPFKLIARDKQVNLKLTQEGSELICANIDAVKFPWAISNLLSNAIRFSPPDSTVTVALTTKNDEISIEIKDEGPGIPEDVRKKMFDPYFQAPLSDSKVPSGFLGLGLTIAKEVVEAHRGKIEYVPGQPKGSIFRISLPLVPVAA